MKFNPLKTPRRAYWTGVFFTAFWSWLVAKFFADRATQLHRKELRKAKFEAHTETFQSGWKYAQDHYTRYYTKKQYEFVFGKPRPW